MTDRPEQEVSTTDASSDSSPSASAAAGVPAPRRHRLRRFLLFTGLSLLLLLALLLILISQHARWLPGLVNSTLFNRPLAGLPAHSLQLQQARFTLDDLHLESLMLRQLSLTGPADSALTLSGIRWPQQGRLQIDTLSLALPETSPASLLSGTESASRPAADHTVGSGSIPPVTDAAPASAANPLAALSASLQSDYQQLLHQLAPVLTQLDQLSADTGLTQIEIRRLQIRGLPLNHALALNREPEGQWLFTLRADRQTNSQGSGYQRLLDLSLQASRDQTGKTPGGDYRLQLDLPQLNALLALLSPAAGSSAADLTLPVWLLSPQSLNTLQEQLHRYRLRLPESAAFRLQSRINGQQAVLDLTLPELAITPVSGCPLQLPAQQLQLSYRIADRQLPEQLQLALGQKYQLALAGGCFTAFAQPETDSADNKQASEHLQKVALMPVHQVTKSADTTNNTGFALKGLDQASLQQGGVLSVYLQQPLQLQPGRGRIRSDALQLGWQPNNARAPAGQLNLKPLTLTRDEHTLMLQTDLNAGLQAELYPHPLFANQSRRAALALNGALGLTLQQPADADADAGAPELQQLALTLTHSQLSLQEALDDSAVLWAPKQFELPLARHQGRWQLSYNASATARGWQLSHQGQGQLLIRHPKLKQNLRLPYRAEMKTALAPALSAQLLKGVFNPDKLLNALALQFKLQLEDQPSQLDSRAATPLNLLPELAFALSFEDGQLEAALNTDAELARLPEWYTLPGKALVSDGRLTTDLQLNLPGDALNRFVSGAGGEQALNHLLSQLALKWNSQLSALTGQAQGYEFSQLALPLDLSLKQGQLQLNPARFTAERIFAGVELNRLALSLTGSGALAALLADPVAADALQAQLTDFKADTLGGRITLAKLDYPFREETADLKLHGLDLSELIALGEKQIKVTGRLNGTLPLQVGPEGVAVQDGYVFSNEGEIVLQDNPAWQAMLQQQPALAGQLRHLNYLNYNQLRGDVSMAPNGQLKAVLVIKGDNRAEQQPVILNFSSEQNILTLLKALRLSDQIDKSLSESAQRIYQ